MSEPTFDSLQISLDDPNAMAELSRVASANATEFGNDDKEIQMDPTIPGPNHEPILQFFAFEHLPPSLQSVSKPFGDLAMHIASTLPKNAERSTALRKLLEAKDAAVRALLAKP